MRNIELIREVKRCAAGGWFNLLRQCSVDTPDKGHHGPCPICGGTDRFHFIDDHDGGEWHCRQCDAPNHGDGLDLVSRSNGITITEAAEMIAGLLGIVERSTEFVQQSPTTAQRKPVAEAGGEVAGKPIAERVAALLAKTHSGHAEYLAKKGLPSSFEALLDDGSMVLVLRSIAGAVTGAQVIKPTGEKRLLAGTKKKGAFIASWPLPEEVETVVIAEGNATSVTTALLMPDALNVAAIDAGNLLSVAQVFRETFPDARIIIAGDNDWHLPGELDEHGKPKVNAGKLAAEKTAAAINGWISLPPGEVKADWDDFRQLYGAEAARQAFNEGLNQPKGEAFLNAYGLSRFAPLPYDPQSLPIRDLAGYRDKGKHDCDAMVFYAFPAAFEDEIARGFNTKHFAKALAEAGMLTPPASGRGFQRKSPRIGGRQINVYVIHHLPEGNQPEE